MVFLPLIELMHRFCSTSACEFVNVVGVLAERIFRFQDVTGKKSPKVFLSLHDSNGLSLIKKFRHTTR